MSVPLEVGPGLYTNFRAQENKGEFGFRPLAGKKKHRVKKKKNNNHITSENIAKQNTKSKIQEKDKKSDHTKSKQPA
ncbi:hypothetical protein QNH91_26170, partial [Klebsiella pneumoniae]|uniref:hypothetical protein n=1 Tax=Klebsiella pneumoniae TaxID=573 RepID=UPI0025568097